MTDFLSASGFPSTGTNINAGHRTNSGLSTQIIIKVFNSPVGALQELTASQNRPLTRIKEIGTDGNIEIVPSSATDFSLSVRRIVFDQLRLPESFSRGFRFINSQRIPFDIDIIDVSGTEPNVSDDDGNKVIMTYKNCWFTRYDTPYSADNYIITETAEIWCETAYAVQLGRDGSLRPVERQVDSGGVEAEVNSGRRLGSMDAAGLLNSLFSGE